MAYFSRLTDIVTCNLSQLLNCTSDPIAALDQIIGEMEQGLAGARRSVGAANAATTRLEAEVADHRQHLEHWLNRAKNELQSGNEALARQSLVRRKEVEHLLAGLEQQHRAAVKTAEQLATTERALESRLAEALRRKEELAGGCPSGDLAVASAVSFGGCQHRNSEIDDELAALKRQLTGVAGLGRGATGFSRENPFGGVS